MSNIQIELDPVALREATTQAIMGTLTPEIRVKILENAISAVLKPSTDQWRQNKSPLQEAFDSAVYRIAQECALATVKADPEITAKIAALTRAAADKMLTMDPDKLAQKMADAFINSCRRD